MADVKWNPTLLTQDVCTKKYSSLVFVVAVTFIAANILVVAPVFVFVIRGIFDHLPSVATRPLWLRGLCLGVVHDRGHLASGHLASGLFGPGLLGLGLLASGLLGLGHLASGHLVSGLLGPGLLGLGLLAIASGLLGLGIGLLVCVVGLKMQV